MGDSLWTSAFIAENVGPRNRGPGRVGDTLPLCNQAEALTGPISNRAAPPATGTIFAPLPLRCNPRYRKSAGELAHLGLNPVQC